MTSEQTIKAFSSYVARCLPIIDSEKRTLKLRDREETNDSGSFVVLCLSTYESPIRFIEHTVSIETLMKLDDLRPYSKEIARLLLGRGETNHERVSQ